MDLSSIDIDELLINKIEFHPESDQFIIYGKGFTEIFSQILHNFKLSDNLNLNGDYFNSSIKSKKLYSETLDKLIFNLSNILDNFKKLDEPVEYLPLIYEVKKLLYKIKSGYFSNLIIVNNLNDEILNEVYKHIHKKRLNYTKEGKQVIIDLIKKLPIKSGEYCLYPDLFNQLIMSHFKKGE